MTFRFLAVSLAVWSLLVSDGGTAGQAPRPRGCATITSANADDCVRLNEIQVLGTHNSYHMAPEPPVLAWLGTRARDIEYTHRPLVEQLSQQGIRKFELDVFADPEGGRYAKPWAFQTIKGLRSPSDRSCSSQGSKCCTRRTWTIARHAAPSNGA